MIMSKEEDSAKINDWAICNVEKVYIFIVHLLHSKILFYLGIFEFRLIFGWFVIYLHVSLGSVGIGTSFKFTIDGAGSTDVILTLQMMPFPIF